MEEFEDSRKPPNWAPEFERAVEKLARDSRASKMQIVRALGFGRHLSVSTISTPEWYNRLCGSFAAVRVPHVVAGLGLGTDRYRLVETFFSEAVQALHGYDVNVQVARAGFRESLDWGVAGVELFDRGGWQEARPYLEHSWEAWQTLVADRRSRPGRMVQGAELFAMLRTGTQLVVLDGLTGQLLPLARRLRELTRTVRLFLDDGRRDRQVLAAAGSALAQIGVGYRLLGNDDLRFVTGYSQNAVALLAGAEVHLEGQLCGLRDQTKPLIKAMLRETHPLTASGFMADGAMAFRRADDLAGGDRPREEMYEPWLLTRATWVECLAVAGRTEEARNLWNSVQEQPWFGPLLEQQSHLPLRPKVLMTGMALAAGRGCLDELGRLAQAFRKDRANARYADRLKRAASLEQYAATGDVSDFREAVLH